MPIPEVLSPWLSVVTVVELAHGAARADMPQRKAVRQQLLDESMAALPIYPVTLSVALRAGQIDESMNRWIGESMDRWIDGSVNRWIERSVRLALSDLLLGVTALEPGYAVATANVRHFPLIPKLMVMS